MIAVIKLIELAIKITYSILSLPFNKIFLQIKKVDVNIYNFFVVNFDILRKKVEKNFFRHLSSIKN